MSDVTPNLNLPYLDASQSQPQVKINQAWDILDEAFENAVGSITVKQVGDSPAGDAFNVRELHIDGGTVTQESNGVALITFHGGPSSDSSDVNPLPPGGTTGQVLAKASNADDDVEWVDQSGGSSDSGGGGGNETPDSHPSTADAADDEFELSTFNSDALWTVSTNGGSWTRANKHGSILMAGNSGGASCANLILQAIASPSAAWNYRAKCTAQTVQGGGSDVRAGMFVGTGSTGKGYYNGRFKNNGSPITINVYTVSQSDFTGTGVSAILNSSVEGGLLSGVNGSGSAMITPVYYDLAFDGTTITYSISYDGIVFIPLQTYTPAGGFLGVNADTVGIYMAGQGAVAYDWFRRIS